MNIDLVKKINEHIKGKLAEKATAISFAVMHNGLLEACGAIGTVDGNEDNPATPDDLYNVGSVSKVYCAAAIMALVDQGKLKLDDPVYIHLPRFKMLDSRYKDITVRMTLCHTSGLPGTHWKNSFASAWIDGYYDEFYDYLAHSHLKAAPGDFAVYCNDGFTLAEIIVAEVSGMGYDEFVEKYITAPIGATSTCFSNKLADGHKHVEMPDMGIEYLSVMGAGGTNTDMHDCAKFANIFISDSPVLSKDSKEETAKSHGLTFVGNDHLPAGAFGLGWDVVALENHTYDLGPGVLAKGGGTLQFGSYMLAIPKYGIAASASATHDCGVSSSEMLLDAIAMVLESKGIDIKKTQPEPAKPSKIPAEHFEKYAGKYINYSGVCEISFSDTEMIINNYSLAGKREPSAMPAMKFVDGEYLMAPGANAGFIEGRGNTYLFVSRAGISNMPMYMKVEDKYPELDKAWTERVGKKYIACTTDARDLGAFALAPALELKTVDFALNIMFLSSKPDKSLVKVMDMPFLTADANTGKQFLDAPFMGSRDTFAPLAFVRDGVEFIYCYGIEYMDTAAATPLSSGEKIIRGKDKNLLFSFGKGVKPAVTAPKSGRYIMFNENAEPIFDSHKGGEPKEYDGGFLLLIGFDGDSFEVEV